MQHFVESFQLFKILEVPCSTDLTKDPGTFAHAWNSSFLGISVGICELCFEVVLTSRLVQTIEISVPFGNFFSFVVRVK